MTAPRSWWSSASTAEKLAQLDGGIECGMTAAQIALNCGAPSAMAVYHIAHSNGRRFPTEGRARAVRRAQSVKRDRAAYLRGEAIDLWAEAR